MTVLIKRYANRKLYNTETSRYITLRGIADLIEPGTEVRVIDNESGEDITSVTLSQVLVDTERDDRAVPRTCCRICSSAAATCSTARCASGVDDASEGIEEFQRNVRRLLRSRGRQPIRETRSRRPISSLVQHAVRARVRAARPAAPLRHRGALRASRARGERARAVSARDHEGAGASPGTASPAAIAAVLTRRLAPGYRTRPRDGERGLHQRLHLAAQLLGETRQRAGRRWRPRRRLRE